jgi:hypothetical protein
MRTPTTTTLLSFLFLTLVSCGDAPRTEAPEATVSPDSTSMGGMSMGGMSMASGPMMSEMAAHLERLAALPTDSLRSMLPSHRQAVANLLAQMNREMRDMGMASDAAWDATADSIRGDLELMPDMDPAELEALVPGHRARVARLMVMHGAMTRGG